MNTVSEIVKNITKLHDIEKIFLFGSYAKGTQTDTSDIDLAIIKKTNLAYHERLKAFRMNLRNTIPVDLFIFTPEEFESVKETNPLVNQIFTQGKILYEK